jgi:hypothetical protein
MRRPKIPLVISETSDSALMSETMLVDGEQGC